jgi:hypothetical protein
MGAPVCLVEDSKEVYEVGARRHGVWKGVEAGRRRGVCKLRRPADATGACEMRSGGMEWVNERRPGIFSCRTGSPFCFFSWESEVVEIVDPNCLQPH